MQVDRVTDLELDAHLDGSTDEIVDLIALVQAARSPAPYQTSCSCPRGGVSG